MVVTVGVRVEVVGVVVGTAVVVAVGKKQTQLFILKGVGKVATGEVARFAR